MPLEVKLSREMLGELLEASKRCGLRPQDFACDCIESVLASRRLDNLTLKGVRGVPERKAALTQGRLQ